MSPNKCVKFVCVAHTTASELRSFAALYDVGAGTVNGMLRQAGNFA